MWNYVWDRRSAWTGTIAGDGCGHRINIYRNRDNHFVWFRKRGSLLIARGDAETLLAAQTLAEKVGR